MFVDQHLRLALAIEDDPTHPLNQEEPSIESMFTSKSIDTESQEKPSDDSSDIQEKEREYGSDSKGEDGDQLPSESKESTGNSGRAASSFAGQKEWNNSVVAEGKD